ncbi:unnamed protein product, partial [Allacma fusca]
MKSSLFVEAYFHLVLDQASNRILRSSLVIEHKRTLPKVFVVIVLIYWIFHTG